MQQFEIYWADLNPTIGAESNKKRPVVIISPDEMNDNIKTVIVAPITSKSRSYPTRISFKLNSQNNFVVLDQIRTLDKVRLVKYIDKFDTKTKKLVKDTLLQMFS